MTTQDEAIQAIYKYAAELIKSGLSGQQVESQLVEKGLDQAAASIVVKNLMEARSKAINDAAKKNMIFGSLWLIGGCVVTAVTFAIASGGGGSYIIAWGAIVFGAIQFFRGLSQYSK